MTRPDSDDNHVEKSKLLDDIVMTLGGRVAEEIIIKDISSGASNDISVVTDRARKMVTEWGMSDKIGPVNYGSSDQVFIGRDYQTKSNYSESVAALIDDEIEAIIKTAYAKAKELLTANKNLLDNMARLLIERETIYQDEVDMIMAGTDVQTIISTMDARDAERKENPFKRVEGTMKNTEVPAGNNAPANAENGADAENGKSSSSGDDTPHMPTAGDDNA